MGVRTGIYVGSMAAAAAALSFNMLPAAIAFCWVCLVLLGLSFSANGFHH